MEELSAWERLRVRARPRRWCETAAVILLATISALASSASPLPGPDLTIHAPSVNAYITYYTAEDPCEVQEGCNLAGRRKVLKFTSEIRTVGYRDLIMGRPQDRPDLFVWAPCHGHHHFNDFAWYRLLDGSGNLVVRGTKMSFCLEDTDRWREGANGSKRYSCGGTQGIQAGWFDKYGDTVPCQNLDITGIPGGNYILELILDPLNRIPESNENNNTTRVSVSIPSECVAPGNDAFANAQGLTGGAVVVRGQNVCATKENGERNHAGQSGGRSVWYRWTAPANAPVVIDTIGSDFDTLLAVYTGSSLSGLTIVAENDDLTDKSDPESRVRFNAIAGTVYRIAVDGWGTEAGAINLRINGATNDAFASCATLAGLSGQLSSHNVGASREPSEPAHAGNLGGQSVWYCWTAPTNALMVFDTLGSSVDTLLAVYTGSAVGALSTIASDDDSGSNRTSRVQFDAVAGTTYHIAVDCVAATAAGNFTLHWASENTLIIRRRSTGTMELTLEGPGGTYQLQVSTNLTNWTTLTTMTLSGAASSYTDPNGNARSRFYRAVRQP
jgi:hypothetical protein